MTSGQRSHTSRQRGSIEGRQGASLASKADPSVTRSPINEVIDQRFKEHIIPFLRENYERTVGEATPPVEELARNLRPIGRLEETDTPIYFLLRRSKLTIEEYLALWRTPTDLQPSDKALLNRLAASFRCLTPAARLALELELAKIMHSRLINSGRTDLLRRGGRLDFSLVFNDVSMKDFEQATRVASMQVPKAEDGRPQNSAARHLVDDLARLWWVCLGTAPTITRNEASKTSFMCLVQLINCKIFKDPAVAERFPQAASKNDFAHYVRKALEDLKKPDSGQETSAPDSPLPHGN